MMNVPQDVFEYAGNLYVADGSNHRISRYTASTAAFTGWIGYVNSSPTGGTAGCAGLTVNNPTPGWCTGGTAKLGNVSGAFNTPTNITGDGTYLYITDKTNNRMVRVTISTGAHTGWIGRIGTSPTGGNLGCSGAAVGTFTPG